MLSLVNKLPNNFEIDSSPLRFVCEDLVCLGGETPIYLLHKKEGNDFD